MAVLLNLAWMVVWANHLREESVTARAKLAALELARDTAPPSLRPGSEFAVAPVQAGRYFEAQRRFGGSPALPVALLPAAPESAREAADNVLVRAGQVGIRTGSRDVARGSSCLALAPGGGPTTQRDLASKPGRQLILMAYPPGTGLLVQARRFGDEFKSFVGGARAGAPPITLPARKDAAAGRWRYRIIYSGRARACSVRGA